MTEQGQLQIEGGVAVVTGAASGIGRALAEQLVALGMAVAMADVNGEGLKAVAAGLDPQGTKVFPRVLDVTDAKATARFAEEVFAWAGDRPVRLVFANAGVHGLGKAAEVDLAVWNRVIDINLKGPIHMIQAFVPRLIAQDTEAQFVVTGSQASFIAVPGMAPYITTKHAVWGLVDSLRHELVQAGSRVGASLVAPSRTASEMVRPQIEAARVRGGEEAAAAYEAMLVTPDRIAEVMIREAIRRVFWIIPSHESVEQLLQNRIDELFAAMPAGRIELEASRSAVKTASQG